MKIKLLKITISKKLSAIFHLPSTWYVDSYGTFKYNSLKFNKLLNYILQNKIYGKYYEFNSLKSFILGKITYTYHNNKNFKMKPFCKKLTNIIISKPKIYACIIPIHGIKVNNITHLKDITIYPHSYLSHILESKKLNKYKKVSINYNNIKNSIYSDLPFIMITRKAILPEGALKIACNIVKSFLNSLQFLSSNISLPHDIGIGNTTHLMTNQDLITLSRHKFLLTHPYRYTPFQINLNELIKKPTCKLYINTLLKITKHILNSKELLINKRLWNANNFIGNGINSNNRQIKFISFMSAIESLVEFDNSRLPITKQVCKRTSLMIGNKAKGRHNTYKTLNKLYAIRSNIVHGSYDNIPQISLNNLFTISRDLQEEMFSNRYNFISKSHVTGQYFSNRKTFNKFFSKEALIKDPKGHFDFIKLKFKAFLNSLIKLFQEI